MTLLFLCVANSARSQIAEGLARQMFPDAEVASAGSHPGRLNPYAIAVMKEVGVDLSSHYSKSIADLPAGYLERVDVVITLCAEEVCPVVHSRAKRLHWPLPDPATQEPITEEEHINRFRRAREAIALRLRSLVV